MDNELNSKVPQTGEETAEQEDYAVSAAEEILPEKNMDTAVDSVSEDIADDGAELPVTEEAVAEEEEEEEKKERICPNCGREKAASGHEYCRKCEKKLVRVKLPLFSYIAGAAAILVSLFALIVAMLNILPSLQVFEGVILEKGRIIYPANENYRGADEVISTVQEHIGSTSVLSRFVARGSGLDEKIFRTTVKYYNPLRANQFVDYIFISPGASAYKEKSKSLKENREIYKAYEDTYSNFSAVYTKLAESEKIDPKDAENAIKSIESVRGKEGVEDVLIDLFEYDVAGMSSLGYEREREYLEAAVEDQKSSKYDWRFLYIKPYADCLIRDGKTDEATALLNDLAAEDKSAVDPYMQLAKIYKSTGETEKLKNTVYEYCANNLTSEGEHSDNSYTLLLYLYRVTGEFEEMKELAATAESVYDIMPEHDRQMALAYLAQGKYDEAFEKAYAADEEAYYRANYGDSGAMTEEIFATLYVSAFLCDKYGKKDTDNAQYLDDILRSFEGRTFSGGKVELIISGKADVKDILKEGGCDLI